LVDYFFVHYNCGSSNSVVHIRFITGVRYDLYTCSSAICDHYCRTPFVKTLAMPWSARGRMCQIHNPFVVSQVSVTGVSVDDELVASLMA
jgi:hypothetical protein